MKSSYVVYLWKRGNRKWYAPWNREPSECTVVRVFVGENSLEGGRFVDSFNTLMKSVHLYNQIWMNLQFVNLGA